MKDTLSHVKIPRRLRFISGMLMSVFCAYLALRGIDFYEVWNIFKQADWFLTSLALVGVLVTLGVKVWRWRVLLGASGSQISWLNLATALLIGQTFNYVFPARAGDFSRAIMVGQSNPGFAAVLGSVALEKLFDAAILTIFFLLSTALLPLPAWFYEPGYVFWGVALLGVVLFLVIFRYRFRILRFIEKAVELLPVQEQSWIKLQVRSGISSLEVFNSRCRLLLSSLGTILIWGLAVLVNFFLLLAYDIHLTWLAPFLLMVILQLSIAIPSLPGRIGLFEYVCILSLGLFNVEQTQALSFGILLHAVVLIPTVLLSLILYGITKLLTQVG